MAATPHFSLRVSPSTELKWIISVSKKVSKSAVVRNLVKRRTRPILKSLAASLPIGTYLLIAKPGVESVNGEALKVELVTLLKKS